MKLQVVEAARGRTHVDMLPSDPEGHFLIDDDPLMLPYGVAVIALRGIKRRHVLALQRGDTSVMDRYIVTDPERPGFVSFNRNLDTAIADPMGPHGTIYVRQAQEVSSDVPVNYPVMDLPLPGHPNQSR